MGSCLCDSCAALCCRYFALPIDSPTSRRDFDDVRWYLAHENVVVFIDKGQWNVGILNRCKHLQPDNLCGIYETRPKICRSYSTDNCDYHGGEYDFQQLFLSGDHLMEYMPTWLEQYKKKRKKPKARKARVRLRALPGLRNDSAAGSAGNGKSGNGKTGGGLVRLSVRGRGS